MKKLLFFLGSSTSGESFLRGSLLVVGLVTKFFFKLSFTL